MQLLSNLGINASSKKDGFFIEPGLIVEYFGASNTIPDGWVLCDGSNGTPDLRNRFIVGAGNLYNPNNTGGSPNAVLVSHTHAAGTGAGGNNHTHTIRLGNVNSGTGGLARPNGYDYLVGTGVVSGYGSLDSHTHTGTFSFSTTGTSAVNANLPPYYGLFHIMKEVN